METLSFDFDRLRQAAQEGDPEIERGEAFAMLAASQFPERVKILIRTIADRSEPSQIKAAAAVALGRIATREAEQHLLRNLGGVEPPVQTEIIRSLGRIGSPEAITAIEALGISKADRRTEAARFASAVIAHRFGLPGHELPFPREDMMLKAPTEGIREVRISAVAPEEVQNVLAGLTRHPYGIAYDTESFVRIDCGGETNVVCLNSDYTRPDSVSRLLQRKALLGVVVLKSPETALYSVSYLLMTSPNESVHGVKILVARSSGGLALAGSGQVTRDLPEFRLRAVDRPGAAPAEVVGTLAGGKLKIASARVGIERVRGRRPALKSFSVPEAKPAVRRLPFALVLLVVIVGLVYLYFLLSLG